MPERIEYIVFISDSLGDLMAQVNNALQNEWNLQGGVCKSDRWAQAMTKQWPAQPKKK